MPGHRENRREQGFRIHYRDPITSLVRLRYLNEPNTQSSISDKTFEEDKLNCFIEYKNQFKFGVRASSLLPRDSDHPRAQYPSFISFVGRSMHGKSFLIRALQEGGIEPAPIPSPGAKEHNHDSTSSDIHLYADSVTASEDVPILYLDCEGFDGADVPYSLKAQGVTTREPVRAVYPRLVYAFSTCVVFVTSGPLAGLHDAKAQLMMFARQGGRGSRNQGFKPSLFVVFNCFEGGDAPNFDWTIRTSSERPVPSRDSYLAELDDFYSSIHVVYIPRMNSSKAAIALQQLKAFDQALRVEHEAAFQRRREFRLDFTPSPLTSFLQRALDRLSKDRNAVVDWALEAPPKPFGSEQSHKILCDLWSQYLRYHEDLTGQISYDSVRDGFEQHVASCLRLRLFQNRSLLRGVNITDIPPEWENDIDERFANYTPCGGLNYNSTKCEKVQYRHGEYHEASGADRWRGEFEPDSSFPPQTFRKSFEATLKKQPDHLVDLCKFSR